MVCALRRMLGFWTRLARLGQREPSGQQVPVASLSSPQGALYQPVTMSSPQNSPQLSKQEPWPSSLPNPCRDPIDNKPWMKLVEECADLFDELDRHMDALDPERREMAEHVCRRLQEILERCGVELIDQEAMFERRLHQLVGLSVGMSPEAATARIISPGFRVGPRILRRARVQLLQEASSNVTGQSP